MRQLDREAQLSLLKFVCSFAWTDLKVVQAERDLVMRLVGEMQLSEEDQARVRGWLDVPPRPDDVDPTQVSKGHRKMFLDAAREIVEADGRVVPGERDSLALFEELLGGG